MKTGITKPAGACLISWYSSSANICAEEVSAVSIIVVVLGCPDVNNRFEDTLNLT